MALSIKDPETDALVRKLARLRRTSFTGAIRLAVSNELAKEERPEKDLGKDDGGGREIQRAGRVFPTHDCGRSRCLDVRREWAASLIVVDSRRLSRSTQTPNRRQSFVERLQSASRCMMAATTKVELLMVAIGRKRVDREEATRSNFSDKIGRDLDFDDLSPISRWKHSSASARAGTPPR